MFKRALAALVIVLGFLIPAAHAHRWYGLPEALAWLTPLALLPWRAARHAAWIRLAAVAALLAGCGTTLYTMAFFVRLRLDMGAPWMRLALILGAASLLPLIAAWMVGRGLRQDTGRDMRAAWTGFAAWALTLALLASVQAKSGAPLLLAERHLAGAGWLEAALLALYAGFVATALLDRSRSARVRRLVWGLFSAVFFGQLVLGLLGVPGMLMSGALHLPVPALIAAGPLFRGEGFFMLILFCATLVLVGPAWCSHLCYIGAWDAGCAQAKRTPRPAPAWMRRTRLILAGLVLGAAWLMGRAGVYPALAAALAGGFGLAGVGLMLGVSRGRGYMAHCAGFCPMGALAGVLGKASPWRVTLGDRCTACGVCSNACRYDALRPEDLAARRPGLSCTLCRDCLGVCPRDQMRLTLWGGRAAWAEPAFVALAAALHACFLGVARM